MQWRILAAMLALTAVSSLALGDNLALTPSTTTSAPAVSQTSDPANTGSRSVGSLDSITPGCDSTSQITPGVWACRPPSCFWVSGEYLMWWMKDSQVPALITTGVPGATALPGVLGQPGTTVLFGGSGLDNQVRSGARVSAGVWLNDSQTFGLEGSYFFLGSRSVRFDGASNGALGSAMIARPFFDVLSGTPNAQLVAFPGIASGAIHLSASSGLQGASLNMLCIPCCSPCCDPCADQSCGANGTAGNGSSSNNCGGWGYRARLLAGVRYLQLDDNLGITETSQVNPSLAAGAPLFGGSTITSSDQFDTHNYFYGGQVGAQGECCWGRFFVNAQGTVALGVTHAVIDIHGSTSITSSGGATTVTPAGFLASGSNSGHFTHDQFAVVPELGLNAGYQVTRCMRIYIGYTFLYWSSVVRPANQIDTGLSGTQIPTDSRFNPSAGPARPAVLLRDTDFWAQGINFGMQFRY
jgi:hypothetical protein